MRPKVYGDGSIYVPDQLFQNADEAEAFVKVIKSAADESRDRTDGPFVQVRFLTGSALYTYRDPSGRVEVGDLVEVPSGTANTMTLARVEKHGRGREVKRARIVKQVASILQKEEL